MRNQLFRRAVVTLSVALLAIGPGVNPLLSQPREVTGRVAGNVVDPKSGLPVEGATIEVQRVTTNDAMTSPPTDGLGSYLIAPVPAGVYAVRISHDGTTYPVEEYFDVRTGGPFLLEACFELDPQTASAVLREDCRSGLYAERQVVALGPHRYFQPDVGAVDVGPPVLPQPEPLTIAHSGLECFASDVFPEIDADIFRDIDVAIARVLFRSSEHTDFYSIDLVPTGDGFEGIFPRAAPETPAVVYYVEAVDKSFNPVQTGEFIAPVMPSDQCRDRDPGAAFFTGSDPGITVTATRAGAPPLPPGFLPVGIASFISAAGAVTSAALTGGAAAAGGGALGSMGLVLVIGGAAAATTAFVVAATNEDEASEIR